VRKNSVGLSVIVFAIVLMWNSFALSEKVSAPGGLGLDEVLAEIDKADTAFNTMKADIVYTRTITLLESKEMSQGELKYKKPKKLYLKFYPPRNEVNVVDGKNVWVYHPVEKQVEKYVLNESKQSAQGVSFLSFGYGDSVASAKKEYKITLLGTEENDGKRFYIVDMLPLNPKSQYSDVRLWVEEGFWLPSKMELYESDGEVVNTIELKNVKLNKSLSDKIFIFDVPRGVEVVEPFK